MMRMDNDDDEPGGASQAVIVVGVCTFIVAFYLAALAFV